MGRWSEPALRVLAERYLSRREGKVIETPEEMCWRVARTIADAEARFGRSPAASQEIATAFYDMMVEGQFLDAQHRIGTGCRAEAAPRGDHQRSGAFDRAQRARERRAVREGLREALAVRGDFVPRAGKKYVMTAQAG